LLSRAYWNHGIMSEACKRVVQFAFEEVGFQKIYSYHHADNPASGKVMQKSGMQYLKTEYRAMDCEQLSGDYCCYEIINHNQRTKA